MSIIPKSKFGDCSVCGSKNTNCVKVAKDMICISCREDQKRKKYIQRAEVKESNKSSIQSFDKESLINDLDLAFSRYIRIRESDINGVAECYTCGKREHFTKLQCGHFIKRGETALRWDTRNARPQCVVCNCEKHGNIEEYASKLNEEEPGLPELLKEESREIYKWTREDMKSHLISIRAKLKLVESRLKR